MKKRIKINKFWKLQNIKKEKYLFDKNQLDAFFVNEKIVSNCWVIIKLILNNWKLKRIDSWCWKSNKIDGASNGSRTRTATATTLWK